MASRSVDLAIRMSADVGNVETAFDGAGAAALRMADDVSRASSDMDASTSRMDTVAESADGMASSSSQAAGGIGDLGGALALLPGPAGAVGTAMEAAAPAIMGVTGASDLLNLVTKSSIVLKIRDTVATKVHTVASKAQRVALLASAGAQRVLNAAMRANPIGLIITALALVAGGFVLAYNKSETFRRIVDAVVSRVKGFLSSLIDKIRDVAGWFGRLPENIGKAATAVRDKLGSAFDWVMDKVQPIVDAVQWIIDKIADIDFPNIPFVGRTTLAGAGTVGTGGGFVSSGAVVYEVHFHGIGPADEDSLGRMLDKVARKRRTVTR